MPHDVKGNVLKVGDKVVIHATITQIYNSDEYCNCSVELDELMRPNKTKTSFGALNTSQVELVPGPAESIPDATGHSA